MWRIVFLLIPSRIGSFYIYTPLNKSYRTKEQKKVYLNWNRTKSGEIHNSSNEQNLEQINKKMFIWTKVKILMILPQFSN